MWLGTKYQIYQLCSRSSQLIKTLHYDDLLLEINFFQTFRSSYAILLGDLVPVFAIHLKCVDFIYFGLQSSVTLSLSLLRCRVRTKRTAIAMVRIWIIAARDVLGDWFPTCLWDRYSKKEKQYYLVLVVRECTRLCESIYEWLQMESVHVHHEKCMMYAGR